MRHLPLVVLLGEDRTDEAGDRLAVREDADAAGAPTDLLVELLGSAAAWTESLPQLVAVARMVPELDV